MRMETTPPTNQTMTNPPQYIELHDETGSPLLLATCGIQSVQTSTGAGYSSVVSTTYNETLDQDFTVKETVPEIAALLKG